MSKGKNKLGREAKKEPGANKKQPTAYQKEKKAASGNKRKHQRTT